MLVAHSSIGWTTPEAWHVCRTNVASVLQNSGGVTRSRATILSRLRRFLCATALFNFFHPRVPKKLWGMHSSKGKEPPCKAGKPVLLMAHYRIGWTTPEAWHVCRTNVASGVQNSGGVTRSRATILSRLRRFLCATALFNFFHPRVPKKLWGMHSSKGKEPPCKAGEPVLLMAHYRIGWTTPEAWHVCRTNITSG